MPQYKIGAEQLDLVKKKVMAGMANDIAALRAAIVAMNAKLDADAGVSDTNYGALTNPPALNVIP